MTRDATDRLEHLRTYADRLNKLTDEAAATVQAVEDFLNECSLGVYAEVVYHSRHAQDEDFPQSMIHSALAYARVGPRFRISVVHYDDISPEDASFKAWSDCSRSEKLESLAKLPELLDKISEALDDKLAEAEKTVASVKSVFESLKSKPRTKR